MKNIKTIREYLMYAESDDEKVLGYIYAGVSPFLRALFSRFVNPKDLQRALNDYNAGNTVIVPSYHTMPGVSFLGKISPPEEVLEESEKIPVTYVGQAHITPNTENYRKEVLPALGKGWPEMFLPEWFNSDLLRAPLEEVLQYCEIEGLKLRS